MPTIQNNGKNAKTASAAAAAAASSRNALKSTASYSCPRCRAVYCELPVEYSVCGITLVAAPHLARAYHHLFPLQTFTEIIPRDAPAEEVLSCGGCGVNLQGKPAVSL